MQLRNFIQKHPVMSIEAHAYMQLREFTKKHLVRTNEAQVIEIVHSKRPSQKL